MDVIITQIKKTRRGRYALFCENGFLFSIDEETYYLSKLCEGVGLSAAQLDALCEKSDLNKAKEKAMLYLSMREHSKAELLQKLKTKFDENTARLAVEKAESLGLINDERFAEMKAKALITKNKSLREIKQQLLQKGISRDDAADLLEELMPDDERACRAIIEKSYLSKLAAGKKQNVIAALARRGFGYSVIKSAIADYLSQEEIEDFE